VGGCVFVGFVLFVFLQVVSMLEFLSSVTFDFSMAAVVGECLWCVAVGEIFLVRRQSRASRD